MSATTFFDAELLRRYDMAGPSYLSYPTAAQCGPHFDGEMLRAYIKRSNLEPIPRDLSLSIRVPTGAPGDRRIYVERLVRAVAALGRDFDRDREVLQVYVGEAAPESWSNADLAELFASMRAHFRLSTSAERDFTVALDPARVTVADLADFAQLGVTHANVVVADCDRGVRAIEVIEACRRLGYPVVTVSLPYAPTGQDAPRFATTLAGLLQTRPERVSFCMHDRRQEDLRALQLVTTLELLTRHAYEYLGLGRFAVATDALVHARDAGTLKRNLLGYTALGELDVVGFGPGAVSRIGECMSQSYLDPARWAQAIDAEQSTVWRGRHLDFDDLLRDEVIQQLVCAGTVDIDGLERRFSIDFPQYFADARARLARLERDGLVTLGAQRVVVTSRGRPLLRIIAMCFDRYLTEPMDALASRTARTA